MRTSNAHLELFRDGAEPDSALAFRHFFKHALEGLFQTTLDGRYLRANPALAKIYGFSSPEEMMTVLTDLNAQLYVNPLRREEFNRLMAEQGEVVGFESQVFHRDGSVIWISEDARLVEDEQGVPLYYEGSVQDITSQKETEEALRKAEKTWRCLVENSGDLIFIADGEGNLLYSNRLTVDETEGSEVRGLQDLVSPESRAAMQKVMGRVLETGNIEVFEFEEISGGEHCWYESRAIPIETDDEVSGLLIIGTEITDQRRRENELRASQRFIERVAHASPNIIYVYDLAQSRYVYANDQFRKVLGYTLQELLESGPDFLEKCVHHDDAGVIGERFNRLMEAKDGEVIEYEFRLKHRNGDWHWISARETVFTRTSGSVPTDLIGTAQDVTERKRTERALHESEQRLRKLLEGANVVPWVRDAASDRLAYVGPQAEKLLNFPVEDWYRENFWLERVVPEDREKVRHQRQPADGDFESEYRMTAADGRVVWVRDIVHVGRDEEGRRTFQGFMLDITERQRAREEIARSQQQFRALSSLLQSAREEERLHNAREIHDELGGALTALRMDLSRITRAHSGPMDEDVRAALKERTDAMGALIDRTMETVRKIATELRPPVLDAFGLVPAIEWQVTEFEKRYGIECEIFNGWRTIIREEALSTAMFRIFQESLTNVARHSHAAHVAVHMEENDETLLLMVEDNGRGITEGEREASLGLLGMRERALIFGGDVQVEGIPDRGTTVTITIPLVSVEAAALRKPGLNLVSI